MNVQMCSKMKHNWPSNGSVEYTVLMLCLSTNRNKYHIILKLRNSYFAWLQLLELSVEINQ